MTMYEIGYYAQTEGRLENCLVQRLDTLDELDIPGNIEHVEPVYRLGDDEVSFLETVEELDVDPTEVEEMLREDALEEADV